MSVERRPNGVLKFTDRDGCELTIGWLPEHSLLRVGARGAWLDAQLALIDLDERDVEDLRDELNAWLAQRGQGEIR